MKQRILHAITRTIGIGVCAVAGVELSRGHYELAAALAIAGFFTLFAADIDTSSKDT